MTIQTKEEALQLLEKYKGYLIALGRCEAYDIARALGAVHNRLVREQMDHKGLLPVDPESDERWMGAIAPGKQLFEETGRLIPVVEASPKTVGGGGGGRPIKEWRLRGDAIPPDPPPPWQGYMPPAIPSTTISTEVTYIALDEIERLRKLGQLARFLIQAEKDGRSDAVQSLLQQIRELARETGSCGAELRKLMVWALWTNRHSKQRKPRKNQGK